MGSAQAAPAGGDSNSPFDDDEPRPGPWRQLTSFWSRRVHSSRRGGGAGGGSFAMRGAVPRWAGATRRRRRGRQSSVSPRMSFGTTHKRRMSDSSLERILQARSIISY